MSGRIVHINDSVPNAVYIGRENRRHKLKKGVLPNPFKIREGHTRQDVVSAFRDLSELRIATGDHWFIEQLISLRDKPLACWCRHDNEDPTAENLCHGDVLIELLDRYTDSELRAMAKGVEML